MIIRPLQETELSTADTVMRLAFGTFIGLPDPMAFMGDASYVRTRWLANPKAAFAAEADGEVVGSNFATNWGSVGFFGPLTIRPDFWDRGVGKLLMEPIMGLFEEWRPMAWADVGMLAISATFVASGHFMVVVAFRGTVDVAAIAPFRYTLLIWAGLCGYLAFGEVPDRYAIMGSLLIVGSGLYALHREVVRRRTIAAAVPPAEPGV